jgi:hypothetical protein
MRTLYPHASSFFVVVRNLHVAPLLSTDFVHTCQMVPVQYDGTTYNVQQVTSNSNNQPPHTHPPPPPIPTTTAATQPCTWAISPKLSQANVLYCLTFSNQTMLLSWPRSPDDIDV